MPLTANTARTGPRASTAAAVLGRRLPRVPPWGRVAVAYAGDLHGLRSRNPLPRYLARTVFFALAGRFTPLLLADDGRLRYYVKTDDRVIGHALFVIGEWDPLQWHTAFVALRAAGYVDFSGLTFLDIGANIGCTALPAVAQHGFARAVAYEPEPGVYELLVRNVSLNGLRERVRSYNLALSDHRGFVDLLLDRGGNAGDHRVRPSGASASATSDGGRAVLRVEATTLDAELDAGRLDLRTLGLAWMDVQGHEGHVLAGARALVASDVPLVLEFSTALAREAGCLDRLRSLLTAHYATFVDLGACAGTGRIRFRPSSEITALMDPERAVETDLLLLKRSIG